MKLRLFSAALGLALLAGCASYESFKRFSSNYTYDGKTYAVYTATKTVGGRTGTVFLLGEEIGPDGKPVKTARVLTDARDAFVECTSPSIRTCEETFGAVLLRFASGMPARDEGGMGY